MLANAAAVVVAVALAGAGAGAGLVSPCDRSSSRPLWVLVADPVCDEDLVAYEWQTADEVPCGRFAARPGQRPLITPYALDGACYPRPGELVGYQVRAVDAGGLTSEHWSEPVYLRGEQIVCIRHDCEEPCYPGAPYLASWLRRCP